MASNSNKTHNRQSLTADQVIEGVFADDDSADEYIETNEESEKETDSSSSEVDCSFSSDKENTNGTLGAVANRGRRVFKRDPRMGGNKQSQYSFSFLIFILNFFCKRDNKENKRSFLCHPCHNYYYYYKLLL